MPLVEQKNKELELWKSWKEDKTNVTLKPLLKSLDPMIESQVGKWTGNLPRSAIKAQAIKLTIDSLDSYNPEKAQLNTHIYNTAFNKLKRYVYEHQNLARLPEPRTIAIGTYTKVRANLEDQLGRSPTIAELADELKWPTKEVELLEREMRKDLIQDFSYVNVMEDQRSDIDAAISMLHSELFGADKQVLEYLYGLEGKPILSNAEIARKLNISQSMVTQIKSKMAKRLQQSGVLTGY